MGHADHDPNLEAERMVLLIVAAPIEASAVRRGVLNAADGDATGSENTDAPWALEPLAPGFDLVVSGVGKAQAAGAALWAFDPARHRGVISLGIGGALPGEHPPAIGESVLATSSVLADEGVRGPAGFTPIGDLGFPPGRADGGYGANGTPCSPAWAGVLRDTCEHAGVVATVSSCSGTDTAALGIAERTGAVAENMEGAAVAAALSRLRHPPRFAEIRVISNTTGDRDRQAWDLPAALGALAGVAARIAAAIAEDPT